MSDKVITLENLKRFKEKTDEEISGLKKIVNNLAGNHVFTFEDAYNLGFNFNGKKITFTDIGYTNEAAQLLPNGGDFEIWLWPHFRVHGNFGGGMGLWIDDDTDDIMIMGGTFEGEVSYEFYDYDDPDLVTDSLRVPAVAIIVDLWDAVTGEYIISADADANGVEETRAAFKRFCELVTIKFRVE